MSLPDVLLGAAEAKCEHIKHCSFYLVGKCRQLYLNNNKKIKVNLKKRPPCHRAQVTDNKIANASELLGLGFFWGTDGNIFTPNKQGLMDCIL